MKITIKQLRRIIKEEVQKVVETEETGEAVRCPECEGTGHVIDVEHETCDACDGEGEMSPEQYKATFNRNPSYDEYIG